jgi:hypothetical protein
VCGKTGIFEPNSFACLSGGALLGKTDSDCECEIGGTLDIAWHGAHPTDGGKGDDPDIFASVPIATGEHTMQYELYFCSTSCLRTFLNSWVDALETRLKEHKKNI